MPKLLTIQTLEEITTVRLPPEAVRMHAAEAGRLLQSAGAAKGWIEYGEGRRPRPNVPPGSQVDLASLDRFLADVHPHALPAELRLTGLTVDFQLLICHEGDIHFQSADPALLLKMQELWTNHSILARGRAPGGKWISLQKSVPRRSQRELACGAAQIWVAMFLLVYVCFSVANWCCDSPIERTSPLYVALEVTGPWLIFLFRCGYFDDSLLEGMELPDHTAVVPGREQSKI